MAANPGYWKDYYSGTEAELSILKTYSYSDRIRYYWTDEKIASALQQLIQNFNHTPPPETLASQAFMGLEFGEMPSDPLLLLQHHVQRCIRRYFEAAGH